MTTIELMGGLEASKDFAGTLEELSRSVPENPFVTPKYVQAAAALGLQPWLFRHRESGEWVLAFSRHGRLTNTLELHCCMALTSSSPLWGGVSEWARAHRIARISVGSAGADRFEVPSLGRLTLHRERSEYRILLADRDVWGAISRSHRDRVKKARKAGVQLLRSRETTKLESHLGLMNASMARRADRGEDVTTHESTDELEAYLRSGAGEIVQAVIGEDVLSSMVILHAARGVYSVSSGNSPRGMECGASHFLTCELALALQAEGYTLFNRAGARPEEIGLREFKSKFGAEQIDLGYSVFDTASTATRLAYGAVSLLRRVTG